MKKVTAVKNKYGAPDKSKSGAYIFTNGESYFTLRLQDFVTMRAAMAEIERMNDHLIDRQKFEESYDKRTTKESV